MPARDPAAPLPHKHVAAYVKTQSDRLLQPDPVALRLGIQHSGMWCHLRRGS
jgi:hypothetical protein